MPLPADLSEQRNHSFLNGTLVSAVAMTTGGSVDSIIFIAAIRAGISSFKIFYLISGGPENMESRINASCSNILPRHS
ncbi:MAG: hypothetical protein COT35_13495 [Nitrospirae bacterium CG08_land_8_20_14_0_20_52_24]|nr:MAG: hypothetical protein COT35_13495 [Nitrospirae bacterium CG08_land_8_20_14_0_20_52_24]PIV82331.1 MAG: hypothetical protein COW52_14110 [Nitrospirae bacterium CG17_big_fil_post_rev_8_21_14_2_50_50_9]PIW86050.1 MAG: hypothetical protein COZ95_01305 [Nitrospirae bacterium CG_4_8_14_3_um_filter_50_41]